MLTPTSKIPRGRVLFSFVVVADTHVNQTDGASLSPFKTNVLANDRARHVFSEIAAMSPAPAFVVHLGDMVNPVPSTPGFEPAARCFKKMAAQLNMPLYLVPGNHDIGDKAIDWMPAEIVCDDFIDKYRKTFGEDYFAVHHGGLHLLVINALLFNSGLAGEAVQKEWIDAQLADPSERKFVFLHYPPYLYEPDERGSYENIDEPGRSWLLERLRSDKVEAIFAGHVHNFWYDVVGRAELYMLPSTAFLRHDFSEFYRVSAGVEFGRGDTEKFGYFIVDVCEKGHVARLVRTHGAALAHGETATGNRFAPPVHTKTSVYPNFGVELRHTWAEVVQIPATGGIEEFGRKLARNDYQLMALWEMGVKTLKVPEQDLRDPGTLARARLMSDVGHEFIVTSLNVTREETVRQIEQGEVKVTSIEMNLSLTRCLQRAAEIARVRARTGVKIFFSKLRTSEDPHYDGQHFSHFINAGLRINELVHAKDEIAQLVKNGVIDGITVRIDRDVNLLASLAELSRFAGEASCEILASVKLTAVNLATPNTDDFETACRAAQALIASRATPCVTFVFDTFMDVDRGYFPRNGFIDRRFNPRPASAAVASIVAALPVTGDLHLGEIVEDDASSAVPFEAGGESFVLVKGDAMAAGDRLDGFAGAAAVDLLTGELLSVGAGSPWRRRLEGRSGGQLLLGLKRTQWPLAKTDT